MKSLALSRWLQHTNPIVFALYASLAAFCTYSCMYAFRKPFSAATFEGLVYYGVDYKILLVSAQVIGYTLSKFIGIKVVSEMKGDTRAISILVLIGFAGLALWGFAWVPAPYNILFLFLNGLPLGMVWGLVFGYLEGRRMTEILGAALSVSFIFSSGFVKSVGRYLMKDWGVSEMWMPITTGLIFTLPLLLVVWLLDHLPPPDKADMAERTERKPMNAQARWRFAYNFAGGLSLLILAYILLTIYRDFRDNFAAELWEALGYGDSPAIFTLTEIPIALSVLVVMGLIMLIKDNRRAMLVNHLIILFGFLLVGLSTYSFEQDWISAPLWMILIGLGLYLGYVPFNSIFFDRLIAAFQYVSNVGFLIYLADSLGYLGSVGVLFYKNFGQPELSWLAFFTQFSYMMTLLGAVFILGSLIYFEWKYVHWNFQSTPQSKADTLA